MKLSVRIFSRIKDLPEISLTGFEKDPLEILGKAFAIVDRREKVWVGISQVPKSRIGGVCSSLRFKPVKIGLTQSLIDANILAECFKRRFIHKFSGGGWFSIDFEKAVEFVENFDFKKLNPYDLERLKNSSNSIPYDFFVYFTNSLLVARELKVSHIYIRTVIERLNENFSPFFRVSEEYKRKNQLSYDMSERGYYFLLANINRREEMKMFRDPRILERQGVEMTIASTQ